MSSEPELPTGASGPVTATVTRRVKPGHEEAYEEFLAGISGAAKAFPGYLGEEVFRPASGESGEYRIVYRFDTSAHLRGWLDSGERAAWLERAEPHVAGPMRSEFLTGLESWFTLPTTRGACAATVQDGCPHLGDDLPSDHRCRRRIGAPHREPAAGSPARGDHAGDRVPDDVGRHDACDEATARMAVSGRAAMTQPALDQGGSACSVITRST